MKILILTVESWNSKFGANTFSNIFQNVSNCEYTNICIRDEIPDSDFCKRYFRISEPKIIRSIIFRNTKTGKEVFCNQSVDEIDQKDLSFKNELYNKNRQKRSYVKLLMRELFWKLGVWKTKELKNFLSEVNPDLVVYEMSGYLHFNRLCRFVVKYTKAKSIGYFWDDNFTYKQRKATFGFLFYRFLQRQSLKKSVKTTDKFWSITEKTKREADAFFGINSIVLTKVAFFKKGETFQPYKVNMPIKMLYTGNLLIGRWESICYVSQAIDKINKDEEKIRLDIYTASYISDEDKSTLSPFIDIHAPIPQEQILKLQKEADVLLFVEAIGTSQSKIARLSFSTKITDYLHSGKCIFAIGEKDTAPMEYLETENAAICAGDIDEIYNELKTLTQNPEMILQMAMNAYNCGKRNHSAESVGQKVRQTIEDLFAL